MLQKYHIKYDINITFNIFFIPSNFFIMNFWAFFSQKNTPKKNIFFNEIFFTVTKKTQFEISK